MHSYLQGIVIAAQSALVREGMESYQLFNSFLYISAGVINHHYNAINLDKKIVLKLKSHEEMTQFFKEIQQVNQQMMAIKPTPLPAVGLNIILGKVRALLVDVFGIDFPDICITTKAQNGAIVWADDIAPYVWNWIHPTSACIDQECGTTEKQFMIELVESLVLCKICEDHYSYNIYRLKESLKDTSLQNIFLALHTSIAMGTFEFKYSDTLVRNEFKRWCKLF